MYRPYGEERKWGGYSRMQSLLGGEGTSMYRPHGEVGRALPYAVPMGRGEERELPCIDSMGRRGSGEGTPVCSPHRVVPWNQD